MARQTIVQELLRALFVLALVFLNFAHQPIAVKAAPGDVLSLAQTLSFCGSPVSDQKSGGHAPCHACRIGGAADLPPAPELPVARCALADVAYGAMPILSLPDRVVAAYSARGPPSLA